MVPFAGKLLCHQLRHRSWDQDSPCCPEPSKYTYVRYCPIKKSVPLQASVWSDFCGKRFLHAHWPHCPIHCRLLQCLPVSVATSAAKNITHQTKSFCCLLPCLMSFQILVKIVLFLLIRDYFFSASPRLFVGQNYFQIFYWIKNFLIFFSPAFCFPFCLFIRQNYSPFLLIKHVFFLLSISAFSLIDFLLIKPTFFPALHFYSIPLLHFHLTKLFSLPSGQTDFFPPCFFFLSTSN